MTSPACDTTTSLRPTRRHFGRLATRCSQISLALAIGLPFAAGPAAAQGFLGSPTIVSGDAGFDGATNTTFVAAFTPEVVIDWTTNQQAPAASFDFLPAGNTAYFTGPQNSPQNYTILNRIVSDFGTPEIELNGSIFSNFNDVPGGTIWFQAPGGILVGPSAVINVANLMLTPGVVDTTGGLFGPGGTVRINTAADSTARVRIAAGANITNTASNSYVAIVAPRIDQGGTISTDGSTALIAGEQVTFSINGGLFDISVAVGSTDSNGISHGGSTGGPASTSATDIQRIAMVAVAKNTAMTMLLGGSIGYAPAASAAQEGSAVLLSGGYNLVGDSIGTMASTATTEISFGDGVISNAIGNPASPSHANGFVTMGTSPSNSIVFAGDVFLASDELVSVGVDATETIQFNGQAYFRAGSQFNGGTILISAYGSSNPQIPGGVITAAGGLVLDARAPLASSQSGTGSNATGGTIIVSSQGGTISTVQTLTARVDAFGDDNFSTGPAGNGLAGTIDINVSDNGVLSFPSLDLSAEGRGGSSIDGIGGDGHGGVISIRDQGGLLDFGGLSLIAESNGGFGAISGDAIGGRVLIDIAGATQNWDSLFVFTGAYATGFDGSNASGNAIADPDAIRINVTGPGALQLSTFASLNAQAQGERVAVQGATVRGGGITLDVDQGAAFGSSSASIFADAGAYLNSDALQQSGDYSPAMTGGTIDVSVANGASLQLAGMDLRAPAQGAIANIAAGPATGGSITVSALSGATLDLVGASGQTQLTMGAYALAGNGVASSSAVGGTVRLFASDATISAPGLVSLDAGARLGFESDGSQGTGGNATGGSALVEILAGATGTGSLNFDTLVLLADGSPHQIMDAPDAFPSVNGDGGNGTGGSAIVRQFAGTLAVDNLSLNVEGHGASADESLRAQSNRSGTGTSGTAIFQQSGGSAAIGSFTIDANAFGGGPVNSALSGLAAMGGSAVGGDVEVRLLGGSFTLTQQSPLIISANATGGAGMSGTGSAGDGGDATGGFAGLSTGGVATSIVIPGGVVVLAQALGGDSGSTSSGLAGTGGAGFGGTAGFQIADSGLTLGDVILNANGQGGDGNIAGAGTGGFGLFGIDDSALPPDPSLPQGYARSFASLAIEASGMGGTGLTVGAPGTSGQISMALAPGAAGALGITGNLDLSAIGDLPGAPPSIAIVTAQQPFTVGGNAVLTGTSGIDLALGNGAPFTVNGLLGGYSTGAITGTGPILVDGTVELLGDGGITLEQISGGSTMNLQATQGAVAVFGDLRSVGRVTAGGQSILLNSLGSLRFGTLTSTVDDIVIDVAGSALFDRPVSAAGLFSLTSGTSADFVAPLTAGSGFFRIGTAASFEAPIAFGGALDFSSGADALFDDAVDAGTALFIVGGDGNFQGTLATTGALAVTTVGEGLFAASVSGGDLIFDIGGLARFQSSLTASGTLDVLAGGDARFSGVVAGDSVTLDAAGTITSSQAIQSRDTLAISATDGNFAALTADTGNITLLLAGDVQLNGDVQAAGNLTLVAAGTLETEAALSAGSASLQIGTDALFDGPLTVGTTLQLSAGGDATFAAVTARSAAFDIGANGTFGAALNVSGELSVRTLGNGDFLGPVSTSDASFDIGQAAQFAGSLSSTGPLVIAAGTTAHFAGPVTGSRIDVLAASGIVAQQPFQSGSDLTLTSGTGGTFGALNANGALAISLGGAGVFNGALTAGVLAIEGLAGAQFNGAVNVAGLATVDLLGSAGISGLFDAQAINIVSSDLVLGANAQLGSLQRTSSIVLQSTPGTTTLYVGGAGQTGAYSLSNTEFAQLRAINTLEIVNSDGAMQVGTLDVSALAGGQLGAQGGLSLRAGGLLAVTGRIDFLAGSTSATAYLQGGSIFVDSGTGGIAIHDANGGLQGRLSLSAPSVLVGRGTSFQAVPAPGSLAQSGPLLDQAAPSPSDSGVLSASVLQFEIGGGQAPGGSGGLYIQNSGASTDPADRRGFTAEQFAINSFGGPIDISINGRIVNPQGGFFTGADTLSHIQINELAGNQVTTGFNALSAVNGCQLGTNCGTTPPPPPPPVIPAPPAGALPPQDTISAIVESVNGSGESQAIFQLTPIEIGETVVLDATPLLDEPVTSVGNEDLWQPSCDADGGQGCSSPED